jgi:peptidoglycan hydrolase-like protein with peptidoglycan-binding domain
MEIPLADRAAVDLHASATGPAADGSSGTSTPPRRPRKRRIAAASAIGLVAAAAALAVLVGSSSTGPKTTSSAIPAGDTTTTVARRTLVERAQLSGTLGYGGALEVYDRLAGTFTWLPAVGAVIERGGTLFRINDEPVVLMYGSLPAYRTLKAGVSDGSDVAELNANLIALGFDPYGAISDEDQFGEATAAAVRRWQSAEGLPQTGEVQLGRVVFAPGARRVTALRVVLGEDPPGATPENSSPAKSSPAKSSPAKSSPAKSSPAKTSPAKSSPSKKGATKENAAKESAASKESNKENNPSASAAPKAVLTTSSTQQIVQLAVKASQQQLAHVGEAAPVTLPDGRIVGAHITSVGTVAESAEAEKNGEKNGGSGGNGGGAENATISVSLALDHPVRRLDKAPVGVELVKSVRRNVLAVPASALVATAGGGYAIEVLEGGRRGPLAVTPGMFANGYVEIEGPGVHEGLIVTEPQ